MRKNKRYGIITGFIHKVGDMISPDAFKEFDRFVVGGKVAKKYADKCVSKPRHDISYAIAGMFYDPRKHSPYVGSMLYTGAKIGCNCAMSSSRLIKGGLTLIGAGQKTNKATQSSKKRRGRR